MFPFDDMLSLGLPKAADSNILLLSTYLFVVPKKENSLLVFLDDMFVC